MVGYIIFVPVGSVHAETGKWQEGARLSVRAVIEPFTFIKLSANSIVFNVSGEPGEYAADKNVEVTVGSNSSTWSVKAMATPLVGNNGKIPASQLYISRLSENTKSENLGVDIKMPILGQPVRKKSAGKEGSKDYTDMGSEILLAEGLQTTPTMVTDLNFKLKTTWEDRAGTYDGEIMFVYLAIP
jgi:hypothetical protein